MVMVTEQAGIRRPAADLDAKIFAFNEITYHSPLIGPKIFTKREMDDAWKALEWGRQFEEFCRVMYGDYSDWQKVASSLPYKHLNEALAKVDKAIVPEAAKLIAKKNLQHVYSMGPTPSVDKLLLEELVRKGATVTYHAVDTNADAIKTTLEEITAHLDITFGNRQWGKQVKFEDTKPTDFANVKSSAPSFVVYWGGTIMNNRRFWQQAAGIAQEGGFVVSSSALTPTFEDNTAYWLSFYDTSEGRQMFESGLNKAFPDLFKPNNRGKWEVALEYFTGDGNVSKWETYRTPRISVQLRILKSMTISSHSIPINLLPTRTCSEQEEWEDPNSKFRQMFDSDQSKKSAIMEAYAKKDFNALPTECKKVPPIELIISTKPYAGEFLLTTPKDFGMHNLLYIPAAINHIVDGRRSIVASAIFSVDRAVSNWYMMEERGPPRWCPPYYAHEPRILSLLGK